LVDQAIEHRRLRTENRLLQSQLRSRYRFDNVVGQSAGLRAVLDLVGRVADSDSTVLVTGESGTGKELIARALHYNSKRADRVMVTVNCGAIPEELLESELFGHVKGAFTNAVQHREGRFAAADGGTIFLDEIGDMSPNLQVKLLRVIQDRSFEPVGSSKTVRADVRVIAATHRDLEEAIRQGRFREDLYYRLNVIPIRIPPLRERREDIPLLVRHFLTVLRPEGAPTASITNRALDALLHYPWPGNIRQLRNEVERALVFVGSEPAPMIDLHDLSAVVAEAPDEPEAALDPRAAQEQVLLPGNDLDDILARTEKALIERVLANTGGHVTNAADVLGLTRQGLYKKMKRLNIDLVHFQNRTPQATGGAVPYFN
jgi:transcriptional regulator with GAF, ATPase, and Fis domain